MVSWRTEDPPNHIPDEIPDPLDAGHRIEDREFELRQRFLRDLDTLGLSEEVYGIHKHDTNFVAIVGIALEDPDHPLEYFVAEQVFYAKRFEKSRSNASPPTGQVYTEFKGIGFGQTSRLKRKMWNEAG